MNKIEKGPAFWKAFGQAAALWAAVAVVGSLLLPGGSMTLPEEPEKMGWTVLRVCAAHGSAEAKIYAFAMGLVFGWAVEHTGRLWPGMGLHCLNNCIVLAGCLAERGLG